MFLTTHINMKADCINQKGLNTGTVGQKCNGHITSHINMYDIWLCC